MNWFPKPYADLVARLRVPFGFVLVLAFAWFAHPSLPSIAAGLPVSLLGLALRAWAAGHLEKNRDLAQSGPYAYVRNPLYIGTLLVAAGLVIAARQAGLALLFGAVFVLVYLPAIQLEEQHLRSLFPAFEEYAKRVPALRPTRNPRPSAQPFRAGLYIYNREYQALLGFLAGAGLLFAKALLSSQSIP